MADITYWDTPTSSSSDTTPTDDTGTTVNYYNLDSTGTSTQIYRPRTRKILVREPENWDEEARKKFVALVNEETDTGWTVTMIISGDIIITDPDVETRSMKNFIPLLKKRASQTDRRRIRNFFNDNPVET